MEPVSRRGTSSSPDARVNSAVLRPSAVTMRDGRIDQARQNAQRGTNRLTHASCPGGRSPQRPGAPQLAPALSRTRDAGPRRARPLQAAAQPPLQVLAVFFFFCRAYLVQRIAKLQSIQIGRGIAAMLVVLFHLSGAVASPKYFGQQFCLHFRRWRCGWCRLLLCPEWFH